MKQTPYKDSWCKLWWTVVVFVSGIMFVIPFIIQLSGG